MSAEQIQKHFIRFLGSDVGVSFSNPLDPREVILYRPDKLSETFVTWAFEELKKTTPDVARKIDRLLVSYETRHGRTRRGINISSTSNVPQQRNPELSRVEASGRAA
ncbi:hypothetical protein EN925_26610 [Mesorhizobium sp. M7A.F.Ca.US.006.04.2.1]|uniref:hypothetical protein n=2 Tax=Mesorhizobium TaxID=68287 RepID=UPI000FCA4966|nr:MULTISPECIES: hypothetical protein [unclassified Mesorhizobium]RUX75946.1 hypothetical protein EN990_11790 [Mesorhizobium sp. M7A.F.Ca.US.005.03.1.1]RUY27149.1 hypothetical protein EN979_17445 [Mesorhizobium sp. M7A.F.Ca.US.001.04.2.1]RUY41714.1 hypothetical protein EN978_14440 [Mesorhizobium sp. M7A.F.Ca.US.001.04.1.1]RVA85629.1 hypothetical protein EN925_26610 [Mesorhizobium sp. M7A.F.Ca.US.006.04.2.1]